MDTATAASRDDRTSILSERSKFGVPAVPQNHWFPIKHDMEICFDDFVVLHLKSLPKCRLQSHFFPFRCLC